MTGDILFWEKTSVTNLNIRHVDLYIYVVVGLINFPFGEKVFIKAPMYDFFKREI